MWRLEKKSQGPPAEDSVAVGRMRAPLTQRDDARRDVNAEKQRSGQLTDRRSRRSEATGVFVEGVCLPRSALQDSVSILPEHFKIAQVKHS